MRDGRIPADAMVCPECGADVVRVDGSLVCALCGHVIPDGADETASFDPRDNIGVCVYGPPPLRRRGFLWFLHR